MLAGQWTLQGHASGRPVWASAGLKHGGDIEGLQAQTKKKPTNVRKDTQTKHAVNHSLFINREWKLREKA